MALKRRLAWRRGTCLDCNCDAVSELYMVRNELWRQATLPEERNGLICPECFEKRLGRKLVAADFTDVPVNGLSEFVRRIREAQDEQRSA